MSSTDITLQSMPLVHEPPPSAADREDIAVALRAWCTGMYAREEARHAVTRLIDSPPLPEEDMQALLGFSRSMVLATAPMLRQDDAGLWSLFWPPAHVRWGASSTGRLSIVVDSKVRFGGWLFVVSHDGEGAGSVDALVPIDAGPGRSFRQNLEPDGLDEAFCQVLVALLPRRESLGLRLSMEQVADRLIPDMARRQAARDALLVERPELQRAWLYEILVDSSGRSLRDVATPRLAPAPKRPVP